MPEPPKPRQRILPEQTAPQYRPLGESFQQTQYSQPQKTERERIRDERLQLEQKAAFEDSLVSKLAQSVLSVPEKAKGGSEESSEQGAVSGNGRSAAAPTPSTNGLDFDHSRPLYTLPEGTVIDCALVNELNGENAGPVQVQVSTDVFAPGTRTLLIPQGARILGETSKVSGFGQQRLAVTFHRLLIGTGPGMYSVSLDKDTPGLDQEGATALHDKANGHYLSIFGASLAIGAVGGLAQIGNGYSGFGYSPSLEFRNGVSQSMAQSSDQVLSRFLNRMPTITIRPGTRVTIYLTGDKQVPEYRETE
jgi:type IV secretion system protein VirB10